MVWRDWTLSSATEHTQCPYVELDGFPLEKMDERGKETILLLSSRGILAEDYRNMGSDT